MSVKKWVPTKTAFCFDLTSITASDLQSWLDTNYGAPYGTVEGSWQPLWSWSVTKDGTDTTARLLIEQLRTADSVAMNSAVLLFNSSLHVEQSSDGNILVFAVYYYDAFRWLGYTEVS